MSDSETQLLLQTYTPDEAVEIINNSIRPVPQLTQESLCRLVEKGSIDLYATSKKGTVKVVKNGEVLIIQHYRITTGLVKNLSQAIENFTGLRELAGVPMQKLGDELVEVPLLWDPVFKVEDIQTFVQSQEAGVTKPTGSRSKRKAEAHSLYKEMKSADPRYNKDSAAPEIATKMGIAESTARKHLQGDD